MQFLTELTLPAFLNWSLVSIWKTKHLVNEAAC